MNFADFVVRNREAEARIAEAANWKARSTKAEAQLAEALEALEPFAAFAPRYEHRKLQVLGWTTNGKDIFIEPEDFRRAAQVHAELTKGEG
jgi:hypothetical protein